jgi:adenosylcobinamide-GDP ribazoletransferase
MKNIFEGFMLSLCFFTQIPALYHVKKVTKKTYKYLTLFIPINGLILSLITILFYHLLATETNHVFVSILSSVFYLFMYGFLHLEAVADITDAYYGGHSGKDTHKILKDSHIGALGAIGTFSLIIVKVLALSFLLIIQNYLGIVAVLFISRLMAVFSIYNFEFHKDSKFIYSLKAPLDKKSMIIFSLLSMLVLFGIGNIWLIVPALLTTWLLKIWLIKNIGFLNGDGLGFIIEINELLLLSLLILIH